MRFAGSRPRRARLVAAAAVASGLALAGCGSGSGDSSNEQSESQGAGPVPVGDVAGAEQLDSKFGTIYEKTGSGPMVAPTIPTTPSGENDLGIVSCKDGSTEANPRTPAASGCTRVFRLTAEEFEQKIANFPMKTAKVWGYNRSSPGPTLTSFEGEPIEIVLENDLPEPTTLHPHGLHQPNEFDGVAGISQPDPIQPGESFSYKITPGHAGTFAYHAHFQTAVQDQRGLAGMINVLPRQQRQSVKADVDVNMTLQIWGWEKNGSLVKPFGVGPGGKFPFDTINGKTGDASGGPIEIEKGNLVRIRVYNASQQTHAMHLHGHDMIAVSKNGHAIPAVRETTQTVNPGDFYELMFRANNPGNWVFHCHFPHHTANGMASGYNGAPVGMTRVFHYKGFEDVNSKYFSSAKSMSKTLK